MSDLSRGFLTDTNVLLYLANEASRFHRAAVHAVFGAEDSGKSLYICPQNIVEFWAVSTKPVRANGLGWSTDEVAAQLSLLESRFVLIPDSEKIHPIWRQLVVDFDISGRAVYDARLVATMRAHSISAVLTHNVRDFKRYRGIEIIELDI